MQSHEMVQLILTIIAALITLAYGSVALVWPERIQTWWVVNPIRRKVAMKVYGTLIKEEKYVLHLRITGAVAVVVSALLFASVFKMGQTLMK